MSETAVTIVFPARPEYLVLARLALTGVARLARAEEEAVADLRLAVTEAAANACKHAYEDGAGDVTVRLAWDGDDRIEVVVEDDGSGFDQEAVAEWRPDELADGDGDGGMGLAIIRTIADDVEIGPRAGTSGTRIRFTRSLR